MREGPEQERADVGETAVSSQCEFNVSGFGKTQEGRCWQECNQKWPFCHE